MATGKSTTLSIRIETSPEEVLRAAAEQEHRRIANMLEVMTHEYCTKVGVEIVEPSIHAARSGKKSR